MGEWVQINICWLKIKEINFSNQEGGDGRGMDSYVNLKKLSNGEQKFVKVCDSTHGNVSAQEMIHINVGLPP